MVAHVGGGVWFALVLGKPKQDRKWSRDGEFEVALILGIKVLHVNHKCEKYIQATTIQGCFRNIFLQFLSYIFLRYSVGTSESQ